MFEITRQLVRIKKVSNISEFHGDSREHGCSVRVEWMTGNTVLDDLEAGLRTALYEKDDGKVKPNAEGQDELPLPRQDLALTSRKLPGVIMPIKLIKEFAGYTLTYHVGASEDSEIKLTEVNLTKFAVDMQQGGTVLVGFNMYSKPDADVRGTIDHLEETEIEITLTPPQTKQAELPIAKPKKKTRKDKESDDPFANSDLAQDETRIDA